MTAVATHAAAEMQRLTLPADPTEAWKCLRDAAAQPGPPLLLAMGNDPDALRLAGRLLAALNGRETLAGVSALGEEDARAVWGDATSAATLDSTAWLWAPRTPHRQSHWNPGASLWRRTEVLAGDATTRHAVLPCAVSTGGNTHAAEQLRHCRPALAAEYLPEPMLLGASGKPLVLHVLNDWGGGIARFVDLQMRHDPFADHLALVMHGNPDTGTHGQRVALYADLSRCALAEWPLKAPITSLALAHPELRGVLQSIIDRWPIAQVRVSSLIGGSLDLLDSGLPTVWVAHDGFPFWPSLDQRDTQPLEAALAAMDDRLFVDRSPAFWQQRAEALRDRLARGDLLVVAPSRFAATRWQKLARLPDLPMRVINHALPPTTPFPAPDDLASSPVLRVVIPGRLRGLKGEALLAGLIPRLPESVQLLLVGAGSEGASLARPGIDTVVADYPAGGLKALIEPFKPHLALLPSLAPETWGYVLDEVQALGIPVLCADHHAYAERAFSGWCVAPSIDAFGDQLAILLNNRSMLSDAWREGPPPSRWETHIAQWATNLPAPTPLPTGNSRGDDALPAQRAWAELAMVRQQRDRAYVFHRRDTEDLAAQRDRVQATLEERTQERDAWAEACCTAQLAADAAREERDAAAITARTAHSERDAAYGYYERDTADLSRQRDVALSQRDALQQQLQRLQGELQWPGVRLPLAALRRARLWSAALTYRWQHARSLLRRGRHSLAQRGLAATAAAAWRYLLPRGEATTPAVVDGDLPLVLPTDGDPITSIVIPVFGKLEFTLACLRSVSQHTDGTTFEVIVVDDASTDGSADSLAAVPGLRLLRNRENLGFVGSCNVGAAAARGRFLLFLNNDTTVSPGWLNALLRTFEQHPDTGLAGAALVYPDGRLQEAGGLVFADASGWNVGRFDDPDLPPYRHVREVDYCSGAAIAVPRDLFQQLGGFDGRYAPAYYEDTDLAMQVRDAGFKVRVQPACRVVHHEGVTAGTDLGSGMKRYQVRNQAIFFDRWKRVLQREHPQPGTDIAFAMHHFARRRVLVIDATTPMPDRDSGSLRLFALLKLLLEEGCAVTFFAENGKDDGPYTEALRQLGVEVWTHPWLGSLPAWLEKHGRRFQMVVVSRHYVLEPLLPLLRLHAPLAKVVFDTVDLHHLREQREAEQTGDLGALHRAARTRTVEYGLIAACDRTWVVSPVEQAMLQAAFPDAAIDVVSNVHAVRGPGPDMEQRQGLLFVGGYRHPPNVDAALWLADDILPRIRATRPDIQLHLVGSDAPDRIKALASRPGVVVHGFVSDLEPLLDTVRVSVAPLRYGAGVKGKVNQALAHGLPVVATPCAVEGMGLVEGDDVLVAEDADGFATAVLRLYRDPALWHRLSEGGLRNTASRFSPEQARAVLRQVLAELR